MESRFPRIPHTPSAILQRDSPLQRPWLASVLLLFVWAAIFATSLNAPPLLDDADATHAQAAAAMLRTGDFITLHVNGIRYLEKPPLPYWLTALSLRLFGRNSFAVHFPLALTVLALALLGLRWGSRAFDRDQSQPEREGAGLAGFYTGLFTLTSAGVLLFTRIFIPDALLSLLLAVGLYAALRALEEDGPTRPWALSFWAATFWIALAAAVLTKGLVAPAFLFGTLAIYLPLAGELPRWRRLYPLPGALLFFALAAPWHVLAGLRNRGGADGHGFFWFYFINEHVLRFLGRRFPPDYNKLPTTLYWSLHLLWLFPWSLFAPVALVEFWKRRHTFLPGYAAGTMPASRTFGQRTVLLLCIFSALVLVFFSFSTNQEYYTFPVYLPLLLLLAAAMQWAEARAGNPATSADSHDRRLLLACQAVLSAVCLLAAGLLAFGLWSSRSLPAAAEVGDLAAHRGVGNYTLSMSHVFDLTLRSFSALRLPAALAATALALGAVLSLRFRRRGAHRAATVSVALMSTVLLIAAHLALLRFSSMLSSERFALRIQQLEASGAITGDTPVLLFGDQALGSSIPFYLGRKVFLVEGRSTSMIFGSTFPDALPIFLTAGQLRAAWGNGPRKLLFVPLEHRADVDELLGCHQFLLLESAGKALVTDRPLPTETTQVVPQRPTIPPKQRQ